MPQKSLLAHKKKQNCIQATVKMELQNGGPMSKYDFMPTVLSEAKKATMHYNNLHSSNSKKT